MWPATIVLTLVWAGLFGSFSAETLLSGFAVSGAAVYYVGRGRGGGGCRFGKFRLGKIPKLLGFAGYYLSELVKSNLVIAYDVVTPRHHMKPGVIAVPIRAETDLEITLLANLITMTPGTLSLDLSPDRKTLYVHAMYIDDPDALRKEISENLERRVLEILR